MSEEARSQQQMEHLENHMTEGMRWYAVNTKPHQEHIAELNLSRLGIEIFCPRIKQSKIIRRKRQTRIGPLFPGYLFARCDLALHHRGVSYAGGVRDIVTFGSKPAIVDPDIIEAIQAKLHKGYVTIQSSPVFSEGETIRITTGPFQGLEAIFERELSGQERVIVLLKALSYQVHASVPFDHVINA